MNSVKSIDETQATKCPADKTIENKTGVSLEMMSKFQKLKERRQKLVDIREKREERKKDRQRRHNAPNTGVPNDESLKTDTSSHQPTTSPAERTNKVYTCQAAESADTQNGANAGSSGNGDITAWEEVKPFLNCNSHLTSGPSHKPKSGLEERINAAIQRGDLEEADKLSDTLANREFGKTITEAIDAKRFTEQRKKDEEVAKSKRKRKLPWGFTDKERWQTKSNM